MKSFCLILLFFSQNISFSQSDPEKQVYTYSNKVIKIEVVADKYLFGKNDLIKFTFTVTNLSQDTILVFPNISYQFRYNVLAFELGGNYMSDFSYPDSLKILTKEEKNNYEISLAGKNLQYYDDNSFIKVFLSFGYVTSISEFNHLRRYKDFWLNGNFFYTGSAEIFVKLQTLSSNLFTLKQK